MNHFWSFVERRAPDECWPWTGGTNKKGYGQFKLDGRGHNAHRVAYMLSNGAIPEGLVVRHTCDNPACCNPAHLIVGTQADNIADCIQRGRFRSGRAYGTRARAAKLTDEQVLEIRRLHAEGVKGIDLAQMFGVRPTSISMIVRRQSWTHI